jgi:DNA helicase-2/ATP-dependent DNA helicase PcrA
MPDLNRAQRAAVETRSGPLLVLAGAGTGKTRVITYRISELIRQGVKADRILAVTFTNKAAREMRHRAMTLLGKRRKLSPEVSTFHSLCVRILRRHADRLGYPKNFSIYDQGDQEGIARSTLRDLRVGQEKLKPSDLLYLIGQWKTLSLRPDAAESAADGDRQLLAARAYDKYQSALRAAGAVDFDDLLLLTEDLLTKHPEARASEAARFDHLLIDEYQDTNGLQYRIVKALAERHRNICVVGDDDQSIYGWRGADVSHILSFARDWPGAKVVRLEENYRSRQTILDLANTLIGHNKERHGKVLRASRKGGDAPRVIRFDDEAAEATEIVRLVADQIRREDENRARPQDFAILFRTNEQPRSFEQELRRAKVPYVLVGGQSFYDRKEIRDVLAYLKVLANPSDEVSLLRIINTPRRGVSEGVVRTLLDGAVARGVSLWTVLPDAIANGDIPHHAGERVEHFRLMIEAFRARLTGEPMHQVVHALLERIDYKSELARVYKNPGDAASRWESVGELVSAIATYEKSADQPTLRSFLDDTALAGRDERKDDDEKRPAAVTLMTLHSAKGLEFPNVFMVGMEEGLMPHRRAVADGGTTAIAEERRLCYVGVTRAQDSLTLTFCKARTKWGVLRPQIPSRFLMEMRGETEKAQRAAEAAEKLLAGEDPAAAPEAPESRGRKSASKKTPTKKTARAATPGARGAARSDAQAPKIPKRRSTTSTTIPTR